MRKLASLCIDRPVFAAMLIVSLVVIGASSFMSLGVDRFPSIDIPTIQVRCTLPGAGVEEIETLVAQVLEETINTVEGISEMRSISVPGQAIITILFRLDRDIDAAAQDVRDRVAAAVRRLPEDADPPLVQKQNSDSTPVLSIALSGNLAIRELTEVADKIVKVQLERGTGVGEVRLVGGLERAINIWVDADRLAAYQLPITEVRSALARQNADVPGGNVTTRSQEQTLRTIGRFADASEFNDLVIATRAGAPIRVRDIGRAEDGTKEQRTTARVDGRPAVVVDVLRQSGANTVAVIEDTKQNLARVLPQLPAGVKVDVIRDQSRHIYAALHEINTHLVLGSILACLVVFAFMRNWRSTVIAGVAIPASVVSTFGMMAALDFTLNSVTMLALVLMVGIVIDDAIVVLENIFRFVEEKKMPSFEAARAATAEIALPVLATTMSLVVIFIPVSFMSSIAGRFLYQFGITAAVAILVSLLVSFTLTPMMSARLFKRELGDRELSPAASKRVPLSEDHPVARSESKGSKGGLYGVVERTYTRVLETALRRRAAVAAVAVVVMLSIVPMYGLLRQEFIPTQVDEAEFEIAVLAGDGTSPAAMDDALRACEAKLRGLPEVRTVMSTVGNPFLNTVNEGVLFVRIAPHDERVFSFTRLLRGIVRLDPGEAFRGNYTQREIMQKARAELQRLPGLRFGVRNLQSYNFGGANWELDFVIRGPELESLQRYSETLVKQAPKLGIVDADSTLRLNKPELRVRIDRARAADLGVDTQDIAAALRLMVGGDQEVSRFRDPKLSEEYDVQLRLEEEDRNDPRALGGLYVPRESGGLVRLDSIVSVEPTGSPSRIDRLDRQREARVRGMVAPGYALGDRIEALRSAAVSLNMPAGYAYAVGGRGRELERTFKEFSWAFMLSVAFMYIVLAAQYESLLNPFIILLTLPLTAPFALFSLWIFGDTLNLYSALGLLVLFGVVAKNAILQVDHTSNLRRQGLARHEALIAANRDRLRPILMTTLALVGGMLPLALGSGPGAEERRTIAVVVIGGQTLSLFLTLVVIPVAYSIADDLSQRVRAATASRHVAEPEAI